MENTVRPAYHFFCFFFLATYRCDEFFSFHATVIALKVKLCVNYYIHNFSNSSIQNHLKLRLQTRLLCLVVRFNVI